MPDTLDPRLRPAPGRPATRGTLRAVTLLLPVLNEIEGLRATLPLIDRGLFTEILMVDGGSTDGSVEYAVAHGVRVVRQRRAGLQWAVFDAVCQLETEYVVEFSPDGNCPTDVLPELVARLGEGYDVVVVSRYLPPARSADDSRLTALGNWLFTRLARPLGRFPVTDLLTCYRGFRRNVVFAPDFRRYLTGPVFEPLVTALGQLRGWRLCEIPGDEPPRVGGTTKMRPFYNGSFILLMLARLYLRRFLRLTF